MDTKTQATAQRELTFSNQIDTTDGRISIPTAPRRITKLKESSLNGPSSATRRQPLSQNQLSLELDSSVISVNLLNSMLSSTEALLKMINMEKM